MAIEVSNAAELDAVRNDLTEDYEVVADIDLGGDDDQGPFYNGGEGWVPIGDDSDPFEGTVDFGGHAVSGLYINRPSADYQALFGAIDANSVLEDGEIPEPDVHGQSFVAPLAGRVFGDAVYKQINVISGGVSGTGSRAGGVVGRVEDESVGEDLRSSCDVSGVDNVSGICAEVRDGATLRRVEFTGTVTGSGLRAASISADTRPSSSRTVTIEDAVSRGSVNGNDFVAGIVGRMNQATGGVLVINRVLAVGPVSGTGTTGGITAVSVSGTSASDVTNSFWDEQATGQNSSVGGTGKTTAELQNIDTYTNTDTAGLDTPWIMASFEDYDNETWIIDDGNDYPMLFVGEIYTASGKVLGGDDNPLPDAEVYVFRRALNGASVRFVTTDEQGEFEIPNLISGIDWVGVAHHPTEAKSSQLLWIKPPNGEAS